MERITKAGGFVEFGRVNGKKTIKKEKKKKERKKNAVFYIFRNQ